MRSIRFRTFLIILAALAISPNAVPQTAVGLLANCSRIMPLGDSITVGVNGGYRNELYNGLLKDNCGVSYVGSQYDQNTKVPDKYHEGHPYLALVDIIKGVDGWLAASQPNIVLLMAGTNDIASFTSETAEQIGVRLDQLLDQIRRDVPDAWIFVASIPPQSSALVPPLNIDRSVLASQYNVVVHNLVDARAAGGQQVRFVDVNAALSVDDLSDGIHPTEAAHAKVAEKFLEAIRATLKPGTIASVPAPAVPTASPPPPLAPLPPAPTPASEPPASAPVAAAPANTAPPPSSSSGGGALNPTLPLALVVVLVGGYVLRRRDGKQR